MDRGARFSRRSALGAIAAAPAVLHYADTAAAQQPGTPDERVPIDIAVVGAGVSGTYCCWRILGARTGREPVLFEMSNRIGGRLLSVDLSPWGMPGVFGELGGMRFLETQQMVHNLVGHLRLPVSDFPVAGQNNFATLRNRMLKPADYKDPALVPYRVLPSEERLNPGELLVKAITTVIPDATRLRPQQWEERKKTATWKDDNLYNWGLWNVLLSSDESGPVLSTEAYALLYDGGGYQSMVDNWNCAEAFEYLLLDFPSAARYRRVTSGYQRLPEQMADEFRKAGGKINMEHELVSFDSIEIDGKPFVDIDIRNNQTNVVHHYRADALVLAMPQRSLGRLLAKTPWLAWRELLRSVMRMPAYKALAVYPEPWWQKRDVHAGRSTTDLPIRQVYYMDSATPPNKTSLMLATYADGRAENFWRPLLWDTEPLKAVPTASATKAVAHVQVAPKDFKTTLKTLLAQMHQLRLPDIPEPVTSDAIMIRDWNTDPFGGGWHFWQPKVKVWEVMPQVRQLVPGTPIYICGEAYANQQGWVEGALTSAEHVLQDHFKLTWPAWLPKDYYIGP